MDKNAILIMILVMGIAFCMIVGVISVIVILFRNAKAAKDKHLCEFAQEGGGCYTLLLPIDRNQIKAPSAHKCRVYLTDRAHTFIARWPEGWPSFLQTKVGKSYYEENCPEPMLPTKRDNKGNILGLQQIGTPEFLANLDDEKITAQAVGYGDREEEINKAIRNLRNHLKPVFYYIGTGITIILLIALVYLQWDGNKKAEQRYNEQYGIESMETRGK